MTKSGVALHSLRFRERMALRMMVVAGLLAVLYWGWRIGTDDFAEPLQVAIVGHDAPWRNTPTKQSEIIAGTDRRHSDLLLYDRKASATHFQLTRRGGGERWWARLTNRSHEREIIIERHTPSHERIHVNRYQLRDGDRFLLPVGVVKGRPSQPKDSCSPTEVLRWLRGLQQKEKSVPHKQLAIQVEVHRQPLRLWQRRALMQWGEGSTRRQLWLDESHRYKLPTTPGGTLEYRHRRWQWQRKGRWQPLDGTLRWGKPERTIQIVRRPQLSTRPVYWLGVEASPCRWPLRTQAIPAGIDLGELARLVFTRDRLTLQHLGQHSLPLQIIPRKGAPRHLGTASLLSNDYLTVGQLTYQVHIDQHRVRLMLKRSPERYIWPFQFFGDWPSEHILMRRKLPPEGKLLLTGGESTDTQAARWHVPLSLSGVAGQSQIPSPYSPFLSIEQVNLQGKATLRLQAHGDAQVYLADTTGRLTPRQIKKSTVAAPDASLYYVKRLYLRVFAPQYGPLAMRIGLLWVLLMGGMLLWLRRLILRRVIPFSPIPQPLAWTPPPLQASTQAVPEAGLWRWLPMMLLLPIALFLNGLGLFVLATLSLSSQALNHSGFLYRQLLWSLVGAWLFLAVLAWPSGGWRSVWLQLARWPIAGPWLTTLRGWYQQRRTATIPGVRVMGVDPTPRFSLVSFVSLALVAICAAVAASWAFQSLAAGAPILVLFAFGALLRWEWQRNYHHPARRKSLRTFYLTLLLLGLVPIIGLLAPPLVHNRFFLKVPGLGTVKLSEFAILSAIFFFASYLGLELFALRRVKARKQYQAQLLAETQHQAGGESHPGPTDAVLHTGTQTATTTATTTAQSAALVSQTASTSAQRKAIPAQPESESATEIELAAPQEQEAGIGRLRIERIGGALSIAVLYLLLLGAIGLLYTVQGDLGPGLILTLCFSLYLLFAFVGSGADRLTTWGNLARIAVVFGGLLLIVGMPSMLATMFPEWAASSDQLQKAQERIALWNQPWRFIVGEQILQNLWNLAKHQGAFQWFNNLHSDFALTAVIGVLSPGWGYLLIAMSCVFPLAALGLARLYWHPISSYDAAALIAQKEDDTIRSLLLLFGGIYLFAQNFIHIGSTLRLTPMTGVTFSWVSSGGTSLVVCYLILAMMYRQLRGATQNVPEEHTHGQS